MLHLFKFRGALASGFAGTGVRSCGQDDVRQTRTATSVRFTSGEENDATEQEVLTLLYRKVTAQLEVNSSC